MKRYQMGIAALVVSALALMLAVLPGMIFDGPGSAAKAEYLSKKPQAVAPAEALAEPKYSLRVGRWKFGIGSQPSSDTPTPIPEPPQPEKEAQPADLASTVLHWTAVGSIALGIVGLVLGPIAWAKERRRELPSSAIAMSLLALFWPYITAGIVLGVTIVVVLVLLMILASLFG